MARKLANDSAPSRGRRRSQALLAMAAVLAVAGCGWWMDDADEPPPDGIAIVFEEVEAPDTIFWEGPARVEGEGGPAGLWATMNGLRRPERARVQLLDALGPPVTVALFRADGGPVRLSAEAGARLGLGPGEAARVSITALRREPRLIEP